MDFTGIVKTIPTRGLGINLNYLTNNGARWNQGPGISAVLKGMGVGSLRYPGGEKSDSVFWAGTYDGASPRPLVQPSIRLHSLLTCLPLAKSSGQLRFRRAWLSLF